MSDWLDRISAYKKEVEKDNTKSFSFKPVEYSKFIPFAENKPDLNSYTAKEYFKYGIMSRYDVPKSFSGVGRSFYSDLMQNYDGMISSSEFKEYTENDYNKMIDELKQNCMFEAKDFSKLNIPSYNEMKLLINKGSFDINKLDSVLSDYSERRVKVPLVGNVETPFEKKTLDLLYINQSPKNKVISAANEHLGIQEVTPAEYDNLSNEEKDKTQMHIMGEYGRVDHQWCAHTVSHIYKEADIDIGKYKAHVAQYIKWAKEKNIYNPIKTHPISSVNLDKERASRRLQIQKQISNMNSGDLIIWKSDYAAKIPNGYDTKISSHIGIIEDVLPDGRVVVIEGNANEFVTDNNNERYIVQTKSEKITGNQDEGDYKEVNYRDGLIRKTYTADNLAKFGYSGYINMQSLIK